MGDRRSASRLTVNKAGSAVTANFAANCFIEEVSKTGARLHFSQAVVVPLKFVLKFVDDGYEEMVTMVWRKGAVVGVSFARPIPMEHIHRRSPPAESQRQATPPRTMASRARR